MSTTDVPGANPKNGDALKSGCWSEHKDGSLLLVHSTEGGYVVFEVFDFVYNRDGDPVECWRYTDRIAIGAFNDKFSWERNSKKDEWLWHDKTPFPWDRITSFDTAGGVQPSTRKPKRRSKKSKETAALRALSETPNIQDGKLVRPGDFKHMRQTVQSKGIMTRIQNAISALRG